MRGLVRRVSGALGRARVPIAVVAFASIGPLVVGAVLATSGNSSALSERDRIVGAAQGSEITAAYKQNDHVPPGSVGESDGPAGVSPSARSPA